MGVGCMKPFCGSSLHLVNCFSAVGVTGKVYNRWGQDPPLHKSPVYCSTLYEQLWVWCLVQGYHGSSLGVYLVLPYHQNTICVVCTGARFSTGWAISHPTHDSLVSFKRRETIRSFLLSGLSADPRCVFHDKLILVADLYASSYQCFVLCPQTSRLQDEMKSRLPDVTEPLSLLQINFTLEATVEFV